MADDECLMDVSSHGVSSPAMQATTSGEKVVLIGAGHGEMKVI